jgi:DNA-binding MarR family transcriptional regulator
MNERPIPVLPCMCANLRRASRALTQLYEDALRPLGLRATQFTLLQALSLTGEVAQGVLGQILAIDSTTLTRTLTVMNRRGWVAKRYGKDRRERRLYLTKSGEAHLSRATPAWEKVQAKLRRELGDKRWQDLLRLTHEAASAFTP